MIRQLLERVSEERIRQRVFHLAKDPLPFRKANYTVPGHARSTLDETDDWIEANLRSWGYDVARQECRGQAFACDRTKPLHHWYSTPAADDPFYTLRNLTAVRFSPAVPEIILICAHKDSPSWIDCPGANDDAIGTAVLLELAQVLANYWPRRPIHFLFCNEEHTPWTSVAAAEAYRGRGDKIAAVFNADSVGVKSDADRLAGVMRNIAMYTAPEGKALADVMAEVNERYRIGLIQTSAQRERPGDDDGSFVKAGYPCAIANFGSRPNGDEQYHMPGDVPERVDFRNATRTCKAILAAILTLDQR